MSILATPEFWVLASFVLFFALLAYFGVHRMVIGALDQRAEKIRQELEEARRLREEAQSLLASNERLRAEAEREVEEILSIAREEAEAVASEMRKSFEDTMARKTAAAEARIRQAEQDTVREIRAHIATLSVRVAEEVLREKIKGKEASRLLDEAIAQATEKLH